MCRRLGAFLVLREFSEGLLRVGCSKWRLCVFVWALQRAGTVGGGRTGCRAIPGRWSEAIVRGAGATGDGTIALTANDQHLRAIA